MTSTLRPPPTSTATMTFHPTAIPGAFQIDLIRRTDLRGSFARLWSVAELRQQGLAADFVEVNTSHSRRRGTIRGLHYQLAPFAEAKLVRCTRGAVFDVTVDLRADSPTHRRWAGFELRADADQMLYVPAGCAHGVQALEDDSEIIYAVTACHTPAAERGIRWDDPLFAITWPVQPAIVSDKDRSWADFTAPAFAGMPS